MSEIMESCVQESSIRSWVDSTARMSKNMADVGSGFLNVAIDDDQEVSKQNWGAYQEKMAELEKNSGARYFERLTTEILPLLKEYEMETEFLLKLCDERSTYKIERDHYYSKMEKLSSQPGTMGNTEMLQRNQEKQSRSETQLQMIEAPLLLRLQDFEKRHNEIMSYAFDVFTSMQKQYFAELSIVFSGYKSTVPSDLAPSLPLIMNNGSRQDIDEVKAAILKQNQAEKEREKEKAQGSKPVAVDSMPPQQPVYESAAAYPQQPTYDASAYPQQPAYDASAHPQQPAYDASAYPQQGSQPYDMPAYQQSVFPQVPTQIPDTSSYASSEMPVYQQPVMPAYQKPTQIPVYQQPTEVPSYQQPTEMPAYQQPYDYSSLPQAPTHTTNAEETAAEPSTVPGEPEAEQC